MRIALCTSVCQDAPLDETIRLAGVLGLRAVVLWGREPHLPEGFDPVRLSVIRRLVERHGLDVAAYRAQFRAGAEAPGARRADELNQLVRCAHDLGTRVLTIQTELPREHSGGPACVEHIVRELVELCDRAHERGVHVSLEMGAGTAAAEAEAALDLIARVGAENLGLAWEPGEGARFTTAIERLRAVSDHVDLMFALNRAPSASDYAPFVPLAEGALDYAEVLGGLVDRVDWWVLAGPVGPPEERPRLLSEDIAFLRGLTPRHTADTGGV